MAKQIQLLSYRAFAKTINVSEGAVRKAILTGKFIKGVNKLANKIDPAKAAADGWVQQQEVIKPKAGVSRAKAAAKIEKHESGTQQAVTKSDWVISPGIKNDAEASAQKKPPALDKQGNEDNGQHNAGNDQSDEEITPENADELLKNVRIFSGMKTSEAIRIREIIGAAKDKRILEELEGSLVRKVKVEKVLFDYGNQLKKSLMSYPERVIDDILASPNKVEALNIMKDELINILSHFSKPEFA